MNLSYRIADISQKFLAFDFVGSLGDHNKKSSVSEASVTQHHQNQIKIQDSPDHLVMQGPF